MPLVSRTMGLRKMTLQAKTSNKSRIPNSPSWAMLIVGNRRLLHTRIIGVMTSTLQRLASHHVSQLTGASRPCDESATGITKDSNRCTDCARKRCRPTQIQEDRTWTVKSMATVSKFLCQPRTHEGLQSISREIPAATTMRLPKCPAGCPHNA